MSFENDLATISLDLKKYRIRIYKTTIHQLGDPKYIQLLINPEKMSVAIRAVETAIHNDQTHRVTHHSMAPDNSYELYSQSLMHSIREILPELDDGFTYRAGGQVIPKHHIAVFDLKSLFPVEQPRGDS